MIRSRWGRIVYITSIAGIIATDMIDGVFDAKTIAALVPMKRAGQPSEIADVVGFLASEQASYVTGQIISVNGGMI